MRYLHITLLALLLLPSCSLFQKTPDSVVKGQRAAYQGVLLAEENDKELIRRYIEDNKAAVTYHVNWVFEPQIDAIRKNPDLSREEKSEQIAALERERQAQLAPIYADIEKNAEDLREKIRKNHRLTKKLIESVYNYLSTSPIEIDNIDFWIEKLKQVSQEPTN